MSVTDEELKQALESVDEAKLDELLAPTDEAAEMEAALPGAEYCPIYKAGRPVLLVAVGIVEKIPFIGSKAAKLIRLLMKMADLYCSV